MDHFSRVEFSLLGLLEIDAVLAIDQSTKHDQGILKVDHLGSQIEQHDLAFILKQIASNNPSIAFVDCHEEHKAWQIISFLQTQLGIPAGSRLALLMRLIRLEGSSSLSSPEVFPACLEVGRDSTLRLSVCSPVHVACHTWNGTMAVFQLTRYLEFYRQERKDRLVIPFRWTWHEVSRGPPEFSQVQVRAHSKSLEEFYFQEVRPLVLRDHPFEWVAVYSVEEPYVLAATEQELDTKMESLLQSSRARNLAVSNYFYDHITPYFPPPTRLQLKNLRRRFLSGPGGCPV